MKEIPTYYDILYGQSSKIFESEQIKGLTPDQIQEGEKFYNILVEKLENGEEIDEGLLGAAIGGIGGALFGPSIGKAICRVLGIDEKGHLGKLLTSRLVTTAIGITLGK
jgi:uncharacterized protein YcfJ